jgi:hypothetical protein
LDIKDFIAPVVTFVIGIPTLLLSWRNYNSQRESKPPELARLESWSRLMYEAGVDIGKIDNDGYISNLSKTQKNLVDNYNVFIHRASLESMLRKIGISDRKVFNKLMSMSRSQRHIQAPGFEDYVYQHDNCQQVLVAMLVIDIIIIICCIPVLIFSPLLCILIVLFVMSIIFIFAFRISYIRKNIYRALVVNNAYYYLRNFYGIEGDVNDSPLSYRERMRIKDRTFIMFVSRTICKDIKNNIYMAGINEIDGYCPVQEKEMKPKEYVPPVKTPKLINFLIKVSDEIARKRGIYPEQDSENVEN